MSMNIDLPPEMESFIARKVSDGVYGSADEVVREAVRRLQADDQRDQSWRSEIKIGDEELERGEGIAYTAKALNGITEAAMNAMQGNKGEDADVQR